LTKYTYPNKPAMGQVHILYWGQEEEYIIAYTWFRFILLTSIVFRFLACDKTFPSQIVHFHVFLSNYEGCSSNLNVYICVKILWNMSEMILLCWAELVSFGAGHDWDICPEGNSLWKHTHKHSLGPYLNTQPIHLYFSNHCTTGMPRNDSVKG